MGEPILTNNRWGIRSAVVIAALSAAGMAGAAGPGLPDASGLRVEQPAATTRGPAGLANRAGEYVVTLSSPSLAKAYQAAGKLDKAQQKSHLQKLKGEQDAAAAQVRKVGGKELARVDKALNGLVVSIDARQARELEQAPGIVSVRPLNRYELDLSETVPYIGAAAVQAGGNTGAGIRVAVLDSGIDYTHVAFGGAGTLPAYQAAYGTTTSDPANRSLRRPVPDGQGRRRLRLRRRSLAQRPGGGGPRSDRLQPQRRSAAEAATARTSPTSSAGRVGTSAWLRARCSTRSRCAARCRRRAAASRCCRASTSPSIRTATATFPTGST